MPHVQNGRFTADVSSLGDEVIVFLIGMRINKPWKVHAWWPVFVAMPKMLKYLAEHPDKGLLGYQQAFFRHRCSSSTGGRSKTSNALRETVTTPTSSRGGSSTGASAAPATSGSGTRRIAS